MTKGYLHRTTRTTTPFTRATTADDVLMGVDLRGRRAVVTGGASGIGAETSRALARAGAEVTLAVRDTAGGRNAAADIAADTGNSAVRVAPLELTDHASVTAFANAWSGPLHMLVNNAGVMALPELQRTPEGWEQQFAANHLGHFALALGLHDALAAEGARIVAVSSTAHLGEPVRFDDIHFHRHLYNGWTAYGQSKTADVLFTVEASRRWAGDGITANTAMPGGVRTRLQRHLRWQSMSDREQAVMDGYPWRTPQQGAATSVLLAASPYVEGVRGRYFQDCNESPLWDFVTALAAPELNGVAAHALDPEIAARLWRVSARMLAD